MLCDCFPAPPTTRVHDRLQRLAGRGSVFGRITRVSCGPLACSNATVILQRSTAVLLPESDDDALVNLTFMDYHIMGHARREHRRSCCRCSGRSYMRRFFLHPGNIRLMVCTVLKDRHCDVSGSVRSYTAEMLCTIFICARTVCTECFAYANMCQERAHSSVSKSNA